MVQKLIQCSFDDGDKYNYKIVELCLKYNIPLTLFVHNFCELNKKEIKEFDKMGVNFGGHTYSHPEDLKLLNKEQLYFEIIENKKWLENILEKGVIDFCYPGGRYNDLTIEILKKAGYKTARATGWGNYNLPIDNYRITPTAMVHHDEKKFGKHWLSYALEQFKYGNYFHIWGHSYEVEEHNNWGNIEILFKYIYENFYTKL